MGFLSDINNKLKNKNTTKINLLKKELQEKQTRLEAIDVELHSKKGFAVLHPIKAVKLKQEASMLNKESEKLEERINELSSKEPNAKPFFIVGGIVLGIIILMIIALVLYFVFSSISKNKVSKDSFHSEYVPHYNAITPSPYRRPSPTPASKASPTLDSSPTATITPEPTPESTATPVPSSAPALDCAKITFNDFTLSAEFGYMHSSSDVIYLGNDEKATVIAKVKGTSISQDDLLFDYDDAYVKLESVNKNEYDGYTYFKYLISGIKEGNSTIYILTVYDALVLGDEAMARTFEVHKMNANDGRVVYATRNGEKYHYSKKCAGENAFTTTYKDAKSWDLNPCGKCAK